MVVAVLGAGAWAMAVASVLVDNGHHVRVWCFEEELVDQINAGRNERYMPGITLPLGMHASHDMSEVLRDADTVYSCIPVKFLRGVLEHAKPFYVTAQTWVVLSKGIEQKTNMLPIALHKAVICEDMKIGVLGGPSFARDVLDKQPTGVVVASEDAAVATDISRNVSNNYFRAFTSNDQVGVQAGGALKNILSILVGMAMGAGYEDNTRALLFTQCFAELVLLSDALGAQRDTLYGLAGIGDALLTAMSTKSRNTQVGQALGAGESLETILERTGYTPEGINTIVSVHELISTLKLDLPICSMLYDAVYGESTIQEIVKMVLR